MPAKGTTKIPKPDRAQIVAIAQITGNQSTAARIAGVSENTVSRLCREPETVRNAQAIKKEIAVGALEIAQKYLKRLGDTVETASVRDAAGAFKIALEGGLLAGGEPTAITANLHEVRATAQERLAAYRQHVESEEQALALLREDAPELASALTQ